MIIYEEEREKARPSGKRRMDQDSEMSEGKKKVSERKRRMQKKISQSKMCELRNGKETLKYVEEDNKENEERCR